MTDANPLSHAESITVTGSPETVYDLISDVTRTGEWSPVCTACWWDEAAEAGTVGAWFTGHNELPHRTWETRSQVVAAERGHEFAWVVGGNLVRWGFTISAGPTPDEARDQPGVRPVEQSTLTESWDFLPGGIATFGERFGDRAQAEIADRTELAHTGIPRTLAAIRRILDPTG